MVIHRHLNSDNWDVTEIHMRKVKFQKLVGLPTQEDKPVLLKFSPKSCRFTYLNPNQGGYFVDPLQSVNVVCDKGEAELGF
jgi:hypothetical protein